MTLREHLEAIVDHWPSDRPANHGIHEHAMKALAIFDSGEVRTDEGQRVLTFPLEISGVPLPPQACTTPSGVNRLRPGPHVTREDTTQTMEGS